MGTFTGNGLIHITIIILRHILYLVYLCLCLRLVLFMLYLYDIFFQFHTHFHQNYHIILLKQTHLFLAQFLEYLILVLDDTIEEKVNSSQIAKAQPKGVAQLLLDFLPISAWSCLKIVAYKKSVQLSDKCSFSLYIIYF